MVLVTLMCLPAIMSRPLGLPTEFLRRQRLTRQSFDQFLICVQLLFELLLSFIYLATLGDAVIAARVQGNIVKFV